MVLRSLVTPPHLFCHCIYWMFREFQRAMEEQRRIDEEQSLLNMEKLRLHEEELKEEAVKDAYQQQKKVDDDYLEQVSVFSVFF